MAQPNVQRSNEKGTVHQHAVHGKQMLCLGTMSAQMNAPERGAPAMAGLRAAARWRERGRTGVALRPTPFSLRGAASGILGLNHMFPTLQITSGSL